jgi:hypothetical protein
MIFCSIDSRGYYSLNFSIIFVAMMKILQITFLWLAGLLVLGHQLIPHHHHHLHGQEQTNHCCTHSHHNSSTYQHHDHGETDVVCHWHQNPKLEQNLEVSAVPPVVLALFVPEIETGTFHFFYKPLTANSGFKRGTPPRAPPKFC